MAYRYDSDLEFLGKCSDEDLGDLFNLLTVDPKDGVGRLHETLTISDDYKNYRRNYSLYWKRIAEELQLFGGNTISNIFRGSSGVPYHEIASDVAKYLKISISKETSTEEIENKILEKFLVDVFGELTEEEKEEFLHELKLGEVLEGKTFSNTNLKTIGMSYIAKEIFRKGGFASYKLTMIVVNALWKSMFKKGLSLAVNKTITKSIGMLIPGLNILLNAWLVADISGPAMRITVPAVLLISMLRKKTELATENNKKDKNRIKEEETIIHDPDLPVWMRKK